MKKSRARFVCKPEFEPSSPDGSSLAERLSLKFADGFRCPVAIFVNSKNTRNAVFEFLNLHEPFKPVEPQERKEKAGLRGARRGKEVAALDAAGAALGSFGLAAFGLVIWLMIAHSPKWAIVWSAALWLAVAVLPQMRRRWL